MDTTVVDPCFSLAIEAGGEENGKGNSTGVQTAQVLDAQSEVFVGFNHRDSTVLPGAMVNLFFVVESENQVRSLQFEVRPCTRFFRSQPLLLFVLAGNRIVEQRRRRDSQTFGT